MKLFIAEKPSLARAIVAALGSAEKISDKKFTKWKLDDLPIVPIHWKLKNNLSRAEIIFLEF